MSRHLSVRRRVELLLPILALQDVVDYGANSGTETERCKAWLRIARDNAIGDRGGVLRRAMRTYHRAVWILYAEGAQVDRIGLGIYFWLKSLTDADYLLIGEDEFGQALDVILPALEHAVDRAGALDGGRAMGAQILAACQADGYYPGISFSPVDGSE